MISIVSGYYRSGTSAMMRALIAGGMSAAWSEGRNRIAAAHADDRYQPNPENNLYEIPLREYGGIDFPLAYQGKLIKVMLWGLDSLAVNPEGYRVIIMRRHPEEIRQSYEGFFGKPLSGWDAREYFARIIRAREMLKNRLDVRYVQVVDYSLVVHQPHEVFDILENNDWPIDPLDAAATIDPNLYRFRLDRLTVGI